MLVAGIDEAGRGSLLGPLVIASVIIKEEHIDKLKSIGVKDSKMLTKNKRDMLYKQIKNIAYKIIIRRIPCKKIDERSTLNELELNAISCILRMVRVDKIYIDSFDVKPQRLEARLANMLDYDAKIHAEHKADKNNVIVGAASIIAKVSRDKAINRLRIYGEIGSGYPSDKVTIDFVTNWIKKYNTYPSFARCSWKTMQRIHTLQPPLHDPYQKVLM